MVSKTRIKARAALKHAALKEAIRLLLKQPEAIWHQAAKALAKPKAKQVRVNIEKLSRLTKQGDWVFVPGKVLGKGQIEHSLKISAFSFSASARSKLASSEVLPIDQFVERARAAKADVKLIT